MNPHTVAGATAGSANTLATMAIGSMRPEIAASTGDTTNCAPTAIPTAWATRNGIHRVSRWVNHGDTTIKPAVATTDRTNPSCTLNKGSMTSNTITAALSAANDRDNPPRTIAISAIVPITAARNTDGSGLAKMTKNAIVAIPTITSNRPRIRMIRAMSRTNPTTMATLAPLTALRCANPLNRKSSTRDSGIAEVSPTTKAGTNTAPVAAD